MESKNSGTEYTGRLENWAIRIYSDVRLCGQIYDDAKGRFEDGVQILTSTLATPPLELKEGMIANTRYSRYLLGKKFGEKCVDNSNESDTITETKK